LLVVGLGVEALRGLERRLAVAEGNETIVIWSSVVVCTGETWRGIISLLSGNAEKERIEGRKKQEQEQGRVR
jgi:hypothetical protein